MNRKQFFKSCACAVCSCAAVGMVGMEDANGAEDKPAEDWRLPFVKKRYAKLLEILAGRMDEASFIEILRQMGYACASEYWLLQKHKGDVDGFIREFKGITSEDISFDREKGIVQVVSPERTECVCPFMDAKLTTPKACNCSLGWQQCAYETLLGRKVKVELKESILQGGKRCRFEVRVLDEKI